MNGMDSLKPLIISGFSSQGLATQIAEELGTKLARVTYKEHEDGEINTTLEGNVRKREVVIIASAAGNPNTQEKEARLLMRAARQGGAKNITLLLPYMFYGRSDSSFDTRSAPAVVDTIETMRTLCDNVIVIDPHNPGLTEQLFMAGGTVKSCIVANCAYPFAVQLKDMFNKNLIDRDSLLLTYPDVGASKRITRNFRRAVYGVLDLPMNPSRSDEWAQVIKSRDHRTNDINVSINADVAGRNIVIFEDMIASGGTACNVAELLKERGARSVSLFATSGLFTTKKRQRLTGAVERINNSALDAVFITDTYQHHYTHPSIQRAVDASPTIHVIPTARYIAALIDIVHMEVTPDMDENANSISAFMRGEHPKQLADGSRIAQAVPLKRGFAPI